MNEDDVKLLLKYMESGHVHLQSGDRLRRMFADGGVFEIWGQYKKGGRTCRMASGSFDECLRALVAPPPKVNNA